MITRQKTTSIRSKITLFVVLTLGILTALMVTIQFRTSLTRVENIEQEQALADAERVIRQLDNSLADLGGTNSDWAWWDDSHQFVQDGNQDYRDNNLYAEAFTPIGIDLIAYIDITGDVIHDARYTDDGEVPVPETLLDLAKPGATLADFNDDTRATPSGIVRADGNTYLATSRALLPSSQEGRPAGVLLMARIIDDTYVNELGALTSLELHIEPCDTQNCVSLPNTAQITKTSNEINTETIVEAIDGSPALLVRVTAPRTIYQESLAGIRRVLIILVAVGVAAVLITIAGISRLIVDPLDQIGTTVAEVAHTNDPSLRANIPRTDEIGELANGINIMLTRLQNSQTQLLDANQQVKGASEAKSRFLSHVSHELRTPINGVLAYAQLLQLDDLDTESEESVDQIITAARHIAELVDEFLDIARIEAGAIPLNIDPITPTTIATEVISMTQPLAASRSTTLTLSGPNDTVVLADALRLRQVLLNLTSNAIKYGVSDKPIEIVIRPNGPRTTIEIRDYGAGISIDQLHRLFVPFDRLDADQTDKQGAGIGLSVTKQLIELMDGSITVSSIPGNGTTFTISLPSPATTAPTGHQSVTRKNDEAAITAS